LRWRYERGLLRPYISFSGPIFISTLCGVILANAATLATNLHLGIAGVGALALSANLTAFTTRVDDLVSGTLYPAICAIQHRVELLRESFVKVNRIALMWAVPFGCGVALFANDLVRFGIGERWHSAIVLLQILGVAAAVGHVGFNWDDYFRARANTVPIAVASVASTVTFLGVGLPLLFSYGLVGIGIGLAAQAVVHVAFRAWYLAQLFDGFGFMGHALRAFLPTLPGAGVVLVLRALEQPPGTRALAIINLLAYVVVVALATWLIERPLIREAMGYLLARRAPSASVRPA
jgi:O-antigen/teichoic acid export membrane protein